MPQAHAPRQAREPIDSQDGGLQSDDLQREMPIHIGGGIGIALIPRHGADTAAVGHAPDRANRPGWAGRRWPSPDRIAVARLRAARPDRHQDAVAAIRKGKALAPRTLPVSRWALMAQA
ncbi:MAG: hypothetical protein E2602_19685 [Achromobacter sp.]|nr:hypothetical protein [Achromobacter sp.]